MNDTTVFANFLDNFLQVWTERVRKEIISFIETFEDLLSSPDDEIDAFVKEVHNGNSARDQALNWIQCSTRPAKRTI